MENSYVVKKRNVDDVLGKAPVSRLHIFSFFTYALFFILIIGTKLIPFTTPINGIIEIESINENVDNKVLGEDKLIQNTLLTNSGDYSIRESFVKGYMHIEQPLDIPKNTKIKIILDKYPEDKYGSIEGKIEAVSSLTCNRIELIVSFPKDVITNRGIYIKWDKKDTGLASIIPSKDTLFDKIFKNIRNK